ncbi:MAG: hypothetical protein D6718_13230 [Acidobacteria bacterium]|nr:MAG: hypothetical protein D6718_13230 [Acidobacteriota bacterium]
MSLGSPAARPGRLPDGAGGRPPAVPRGLGSDRARRWALRRRPLPASRPAVWARAGSPAAPTDEPPAPVGRRCERAAGAGG